MRSRNHDPEPAWTPGFWKHVPWAALLSIVVFAISCVALGLVLWDSDGKDIAAWPNSSRTVSVSVMLSLGVSIANLCLAIALSKGYEISWWLQALKGAELRKLQFDLRVQQDVSEVLSRNLALDMFAIAAVVSLVVSLVDGPLIQKASTVGVRTFPPVVNGVGVDVSNASLPVDFSGFEEGPTTGLMLTPLFGNVDRAYSNREAMTMPVDNCSANTTCVFTVSATGFDVNCSESSVAYDMINVPHASGATFAAFNVSIAFDTTNGSSILYDTINVESRYKPYAACIGDFLQRRCVLQLATVQYPVSNDTVQLTYAGYVELVTGSQDTGGIKTMLAGVESILEALYTSYARLSQVIDDAARDFVIVAFGQSASNYLTSDFSTYGNCNMTWEDPTTDIVNAVRELMFRSAIAYSDSNHSAVDPQQLTASFTKVTSAYKSHYEFLAITIACMALQVLIIFFLLHGWHHLGRHVSLDTFEIARVLGAPMLQGGSSIASIDEALSLQGRKKLQYGEILSDVGISAATSDGVSALTQQVMTDASPHELLQFIEPKGNHQVQVGRPRLGMNGEEQVGDIQPGQMY
ncbi:hypothetical protein V8C37DRAFT_419315 [Trichoderma ceciliae]